jgi:hypothetical protein
MSQKELLRGRPIRVGYRQHLDRTGEPDENDLTGRRQMCESTTITLMDSHCPVSYALRTYTRRRCIKTRRSIFGGIPVFRADADVKRNNRRRARKDGPAVRNVTVLR